MGILENEVVEIPNQLQLCYTKRHKIRNNNLKN